MNDQPADVPSAPVRKRKPVSAFAWVGVLVAVLTTFLTLWEMFAVGVGLALGGTGPATGQRDRWFLTFVVIAAVLGCCVVIAAVGRRWVALVLSIVLGAGVAVLALGSWNGTSYQADRQGSSLIDRDDRPYCVCHSGGTCDCPGG